MLEDFSSDSRLWLLSGAIALILSLLFRSQKRLSIFLLLGGALILRIWAANLDPFLHPWDERFHALVAKNMAENPFAPMLHRTTVLPYDYVDWTQNHIWLHKPPLFLWQMALSIKLLGANEFAVRLPSVLLSTATVGLFYLIGLRTGGRAVAFWAAWLLAWTSYQLGMVAGAWAIEHNDVSFLFYVTLSIFLWLNFEYSGKRYYIYLTGLAAGLAVLNKWAPGILVYAGWGVAVLFDARRRLNFKPYLEIAQAFVITCAVAAPWYLYIHSKFPVEAAYEMEFNRRHFTEVIEGHSGELLFHFKQIATLYSVIFKYTWPLMLWALVAIRPLRVAVGFWAIFGITYVFFSLAQTKMQQFCIIASPILFVGAGLSIEKVRAFFLQFNSKKEVERFTPFFMLIIAWLTFKLNIFETEFTPKYYWWAQHARHARIYKALPTLFPKGEKVVIFNTPEKNNINLMFYADYPAYAYLPSPEQLRVVKTAGYRAAIYDNGRLPDVFKNDTTITIIPDDRF